MKAFYKKSGKKIPLINVIFPYLTVLAKSLMAHKFHLYLCSRAAQLPIG